MSSREPYADDLVIRISKEDTEALRRVRADPPMSPAEYLFFLSQFRIAPERVERPLLRGEPFRL